MEAKILITGATGNVGSQVAAQLCERGVPPVAVVHSADKAAAVKAHCAEVRVADLRDEQQVASVFEGIDKVFLVTPATPDQLEIGDRLIAAADAAGVDHVVKLSIIGAEYEPGILLGRWHRHMEKMIERSSMRWTFLRPNGYMQNYIAAWGATIGTEGKIYLPVGDGAMSLIDARDVAAAGVEALLGDGHAGQAYTLTGEVAHTNSEIAKLFAHVLEKPVDYVDVPEAAARSSLEGAGVPEPLVTGILELWALQKGGAAAGVTTTFQELTGRSPRSFAQFVRDHASAWGAQDDVQLGKAGMDG